MHNYHLTDDDRVSLTYSYVQRAIWHFTAGWRGLIEYYCAHVVQIDILRGSSR